MVEAERAGKAVLDAAMRVHTELGPGLLESAYETCMAYELAGMGFAVARQVSVPVRYRGKRIDVGYRLDLLVNDCVVVELKAVDNIERIHIAQILTYLKLKEVSLGYLLNFNVTHMRDGIRRVVLKHGEGFPSRPWRPSRFKR